MAAVRMERDEVGEFLEMPRRPRSNKWPNDAYKWPFSSYKRPYDLYKFSFFRTKCRMSGTNGRLEVLSKQGEFGSKPELVMADRGMRSAELPSADRENVFFL